MNQAGLWREGILPSLAPTGAFQARSARRTARQGKAECLPSEDPSTAKSDGQALPWQS